MSKIHDIIDLHERCARDPQDEFSKDDHWTTADVLRQLTRLALGIDAYEKLPDDAGAAKVSEVTEEIENALAAVRTAGLIAAKETV